MSAGRRALHAAASAPFAGPAREEGSHDQGKDGCKKGQEI